MMPALFLDRDGVINVEKGYLYKIDDFEFIEGVFGACLHFIQSGYKIVIVTNQAGIARGLYTESDYKILTDWMLSEFLRHGVVIDGVYHCPHHPDFTGPCLCRKPNPGLIYQAYQDLNLSLGESILVGDKKTDLIAAKIAGIKNRVLVRSGHKISNNDEHCASLVIDSIAKLPEVLGDR